MTMPANVYVLIINFNQLNYTVDCINSILSSHYQNFSLLLVDNGSSEPNYKLLRDSLPKDKRLNVIRIINNIGYVGAINKGLLHISAAKAEFVLVMNNDTLIASDAISELVMVAEKHKRKAIVSGKIYEYHRKNILQYIGQAQDPKGGIRHKALIGADGEIDKGQYDLEIEMGMLDDVFWLFPLSLYDAIGGYSDFFYLYVEQNDFALRAVKQGYKLIYTPKAHLWHKGGVTTCNSNKESAKIRYWNTLGSLKLAHLHLPESEAKIYIFNFLIRQFVLLILKILRGQGKILELKVIFLAYWHYSHWKVVKYKDNGFNPF